VTVAAEITTAIVGKTTLNFIITRVILKEITESTPRGGVNRCTTNLMN